MNPIYRFILMLGLAGATFAADPAPTVEKEEDEIPGVHLQKGPGIAKLGSVAELDLPEGYRYVGEDSLDKFFELTHNFRGGKELGVVIAPEGWLIFFDYDPIGYVKDEEKNDLKADELYKSRVAGIDSGNEERRSRKWAELKLQGWAAEPHYDEATHNLKWALKLSSSADEHKRISINEDIRLLGRSGVISATLVCDLPSFKDTEKKADQLLTKFSFVKGERYAEFKSGDKIAKYGLAALVVGGVGAVALKTGILAKFWKFFVALAVGLGSLVTKLWKKITGKDPQ